MSWLGQLLGCWTAGPLSGWFAGAPTDQQGDVLDEHGNKIPAPIDTPADALPPSNSLPLTSSKKTPSPSPSPAAVPVPVATPEPSLGLKTHPKKGDLKTHPKKEDDRKEPAASFDSAKWAGWDAVDGEDSFSNDNKDMQEDEDKDFEPAQTCHQQENDEEQEEEQRYEEEQSDLHFGFSNKQQEEQEVSSAFSDPTETIQAFVPAPVSPSVAVAPKVVEKEEPKEPEEDLFADMMPSYKPPARVVVDASAFVPKAQETKTTQNEDPFAESTSFSSSLSSTRLTFDSSELGVEDLGGWGETEVGDITDTIVEEEPEKKEIKEVDQKQSPRKQKAPRKAPAVQEKKEKAPRIQATKAVISFDDDDDDEDDE